MKPLNENFNQWIKYFKSDKVKYVFQCLKDRMAFCEPNSNYSIIRFQLHHCLVFGLNQAAITLTNHYLEKFLKLSLIEKSTQDKITNLKSYAQSTAPLVQAYGSNDLSKSIRAAKGQGIITKKVAVILEAFSKQFRNPFSHSDIKELFMGETANVRAYSFNEPGVIQDQATVDIANFIPIQSAKQDTIAKETAYAYFIL